MTKMANSLVVYIAPLRQLTFLFFFARVGDHSIKIKFEEKKIVPRDRIINSKKISNSRTRIYIYKKKIINWMETGQGN